MALPAAFLSRLAAELGADTAATIAATMREDKDQAHWLNPLRPGEAPAMGAPMAGLPGMVAVAGQLRERLTHHPAAAGGRIYPINPSSAVAVQALAPAPGERVLDLAAAPGGKTILSAGRMANAGAIVAVDSSRGRFHRLRANLQRCGVALAECRLADGRRFGRTDAERFDRVLLDAPCASEARFRDDDPATTRYWSARKVKECAHKQRGLLRAAFRCLRPGGVLLYCTCSFSKRENEDVVAYLLRQEPSARPMPLVVGDIAAPTCGGLGGMEGTLRILPNRLFDGLFLARLTKQLGGGVVQQPPAGGG